MTLGRLGVWYSTDKLDGAQLRDLLATVEAAGYSAFWYPESRGYESMSLAGYLLANSRRLIIGSSIANIYARDSFTARRALATLDDANTRYDLGLVLDRTGRSLEAMNEYKLTLARNPTHRDALNNLGVMYARAGRLAEAAAQPATAGDEQRHRDEHATYRPPPRRREPQPPHEPEPQIRVHDERERRDDEREGHPARQA